MTAVVVGGANVDVIAAPAGPLQPGLSTPGRIRISAGGAGRNVAENLARLGIRTRLIAAVDAHPISDLAVEQAARAGVDTSAVFRVSGLGNYYAAVQQAGALAWGISDMAASESLTPGNLDAQASALRAADAVAVDANLAPATILRAVELAAGRSLCLLPVSAAKSPRMRAVLPQAALIVLSAQEAEVLAGAQIRVPKEALRAAQSLRASGRTTVVITMGTQGLGWVAGEARWVEPIAATVVDPSGAGDAVAAVAIFALLTGLDPQQAAHLATAAAAMTVGVEGATHPGLSLQALHAQT